MLEIIQTELINQHYNDLLASHFGIDKIKKLIGWKYFWPNLRKDVETYVKGCNVCLTLKTVWHKPYDNLQLLIVPTYQ